MEKKGQGAIEYLLIIGAAILVVAVIIIALVTLTGGATDTTTIDDLTPAQLLAKCNADCLAQGGEWGADGRCNQLIAPRGDYDCQNHNPATPI